MDDKEIDKILQGFVYDINLHLVDGEEAIKDHPIMVETKAEIKALIKQEKQELLNRVEEEVIGDDDEDYGKVDLMGCGYYHQEIENMVRVNQRHRISDMRDKL